jgi:hypothetical protein
MVERPGNYVTHLVDRDDNTKYYAERFQGYVPVHLVFSGRLKILSISTMWLIYLLLPKANPSSSKHAL